MLADIYTIALGLVLIPTAALPNVMLVVVAAKEQESEKE